MLVWIWTCRSTLRHSLLLYVECKALFRLSLFQPRQPLRKVSAELMRTTDLAAELSFPRFISDVDHRSMSPEVWNAWYLSGLYPKMVAA